MKEESGPLTRSNREVRFIGVLGRRYKLRWSGNSSGIGGIGILVKEKL